MKYQEYIQKLPSLQNLRVQYISFILIYFTFAWKLIYARDFVSGRLEYQWIFPVITSQDVKLFTIMFVLGVLVWHATSEAKRKYKLWRNS